MKNSFRQKSERKLQQAFSLLEMLAAVTVFSVLMGFLAYMVTGVQKAWLIGDQKVEIYQNGRVSLDLFSRELVGAVATDQIQFVQTPNLSQLVPDLAPNSPSLFWMGPGKLTEHGHLWSYGYYLTRDDQSKTYQLVRFSVAPGDKDNKNDFYRGLNAYAEEQNVAKQRWSFANQALWITGLNKNAFDFTNQDRAVSVVAEGVVAMWIRCLDLAGNPIPWLSTMPTSLYNSGTIQFSSGACFQMTTAAASFPAVSAVLENKARTFRYTQGPTTSAIEYPTLPGNRVPGSVEITLVVVDTRTLQRGLTVPPMPAPLTPAAVPAQMTKFNQDLIAAGITTARSFSVRVKMANAALNRE
jgi:prepilin-type N-terminal cleavage/methylation domain-containing protein